MMKCYNTKSITPIETLRLCTPHCMICCISEARAVTPFLHFQTTGTLSHTRLISSHYIIQNWCDELHLTVWMKLWSFKFAISIYKSFQWDIARRVLKVCLVEAFVSEMTADAWDSITVWVTNVGLIACEPSCRVALHAIELTASMPLCRTRTKPRMSPPTHFSQFLLDFLYYFVFSPSFLRACCWNSLKT